MQKLDEVQTQILELAKSSPRAARNPTRFVREAVKEFSISALKSCIETCDRCECKCSARTLPSGSGSVPLLCIMDYPSAAQAKAEKCIGMFDGDEETEKLLRYCFEPHGVDFDQVFFMNTVSCASFREVKKFDGSTEKIYRTPIRKEIENCSLYVKYAIEMLFPPMMLIMGNVASNVFHHEPISKARGSWIDCYGIRSKITYSPHEVLDARGQFSNARWAEMGAQFKQDVGDALEWYKSQWSDSVLFK